VETDEPQFATFEEGLIGRHLTCVPLSRRRPNIEQHGEELSRADQSAPHHHDELNYTPPDTESGRRLARG
jgi:hypothetical protein